MIKKEVGQFVLDNRQARKITQVKLAKKTGISQAKISKVEKGVLNLSVPEFSKVLKVFGYKIRLNKE